MAQRPLSRSLWPLFNLRLAYRDVLLRPVEESELDELAAMLPDDFEHDPSATLLDGLDLAANRRRLFIQGYWHNWGTWSVQSWKLMLGVHRNGTLIGVQILEADDFLELRTVDSSSWLVHESRGLGVGTSMRIAMLGLAFDHLGADVAVTSSRAENSASLGVSRKIGYLENGVSTSRSPSGAFQLQHLRITRQQWLANAWGGQVKVAGLNACAPYFGLEEFLNHEDLDD